MALSRIHPQSTSLSVAVALALVSAAPWAHAADDGATTQLEQIIVTGTRTKDRTVLDSPVPVDVLTAEDLRSSGAVNGELGAALAALLPSFNFPRQSNSGGSDHVRAGQLRGLSPDQVLVLINGKRVHTSALVNTDTKIGRGTTPVDFNAIPLSAVKRVEVLRDGAGAQYGSDAIAGVVNIILDDAPQGVRIDASYGGFHTDFKPTGKTITDGQSGYAAASFGSHVGADGFVRFGVELNNHAATNRAGYDDLPFFEDATPANLATIGRRNYAAGDPKTENYSAWLNSEIALDDHVSVYGFGTYAARHSIGNNYYRYPDGSANVPAIYPNGYRPESLGHIEDLHATAGTRGQFDGWTFDASATHGSNRFDYDLRNSLNASLGAASPTRFRTGSYQFEQSLFNLDLTRELGFGERIFTLAAGAEVRREHFQTQPADPAAYAVGPVTGAPIGAQAGANLTPQDTANLNRVVSGLYADLAGNVTDRLFIDAAARQEHYDDFGNEFTAKLSGRFEFVPGFALRGALSNNVRAPSLSQVGFESTGTGYGADGRLVQSRILSVNNPVARALGAQPLDAEKSRNASLGFTAQIGEGFDVSLDVFRIDVDDRITLSEKIGPDGLDDFIFSQFGIAGVQQVSFFTNAVDTRTDGAELVANYRFPLAGGTLALTGTYSYNDTSIRKIHPTPPQLTALGSDNVLIGVEETNTLLSAAPRQRAFIAARWDSSDWSLSSRITRQGSTTRVFNFGGGFEPTQTYSAKYQLDAEVEYRVNDGLSIALGGNNLTDQYPDKSIYDISYFGNFPYDVISPIGVNGAYYYGRIHLAF